LGFVLVEEFYENGTSQTQKMKRDLLGYSAGIPIGVYIVGNMGYEKGSFFSTLIYGLVCGIPGYMYMWTLEKERQPLILIACSTIGATSGFNRSRKYKNPSDNRTAFMNFNNSEFNLAVPEISLRPNPFRDNDLMLNVDLVKVRF